jgi:hypothetical protein
MKNIDIKSLLDRKISWPVILVGLLFLASCAEQPRSVAELLRQDPAGFFSGLFHGGTIIFSFIGSIFTDVRIYAFPNTGGWYDFGYLIGASFFFGGMFTDA